MATKTMYRILNLQSGDISLDNYVYDGYVELDRMVLEYDDQLKQEHAQMVADAIDKRVHKMNADIVVMESKKQDFLAIAYQQPKEPVVQNGEWEEVDDKPPF